MMSTLRHAQDEGVPLVRSVAQDVTALVAGYAFAEKADPRRAERELGKLAFKWVLAILQKMGVMRDEGEVYELDQLKLRLGIVPKYGRYFDALIRRLEEEGLVTVGARGIETTPRVRGYALEKVEEQVARFKKSFLKRYPDCSGLLSFMACCLSRFDEIITGRVDVAEVLFQDGNMDVFAEVFRGDAVSDYFNRVVADAVRSAVARLGDGASKIRVVEIGAGTGGTTAEVLAALQPLSDVVEVCFTDISSSFVRYARRRFADQYPWLDYRTLDIETDLSRQGFEAHGFDIVVAANVLHDTRDIELTLEQTRRLLKPGGLLVLNEFTAVKDCLFFSGALLHGYWLFEDPDRRLRDSCLLSVPQWDKVLERTGFEVAASFALPTQSPGSDCSQSVILCGVSRTALPLVEAGAEQSEAGKSGIIGKRIEQDILTLLGVERSAAYSARRPLMEMGLDSIELVELKSMMRQQFGVKLSPAFLFEHETQEKMAEALAATVSDEVVRELAQHVVGGAESGRDGTPAPATAGAAADRPAVEVVAEGAVAIVGVACRLPGGATSPEAFWKLLERGEDGIVAMPPGRWQWPAFIDVEGQHKGIDRGGFLERIDEFDARFFRTSPKEAELMDPQQRLLLELSWEAMEDGGYRPSELSGRKIGVFVGVCQGDYRDVLIAAAESAEAYVGSGSAFSMLANRLSYFYDFKGPSMTIDTACSSSLFALHDAMTAIRRGDCEEALVGAVNLICSPTISIAYYQAGMLSPTGKCQTFDEAANGYVRGEGGAMLLLKPLAKALEQGDSIYGLVKGTAVNHGGQAASLTAPKPEAQAEVIEAAWRQAGVAPSSAGYVEAHGTGTKLGDPIEIGGLIEAFRRLSGAAGEDWPARPHCGLGSVKSNVGHLEGAAGLTGLIKLLLSIRHGQIPRTLNFRHLNPDIDLAGSPFYIAERNVAWPRFQDEQGRDLPRRAGVSSFGFGGANAHAVVEEYQSPGPDVAGEDGPYLIPLSARSREQLIERARGLLDFVQQLDRKTAPRPRRAGLASGRVLDDLQDILRRRFDLGEDCTPGLEWEELGWGAVETNLFLAAIEEARGVRLPSRALIECPTLRSLAERIERDHLGTPPEGDAGAFEAGVDLAAVAYTLQVGREPMEERVAFLVKTEAELVAALRGYIVGDRLPKAKLESEDQRSIEASLAARDLPKLASLWTRGAEIDWARLYPAARPRRAHLPTYPFARERYWVSKAAEPLPAASAGARLHPLVHQNTSDLVEQRFSSVFTGQEFFLADHRFEGQSLLPGVAYLEMAREAVARASGNGEPPAAVRLRNVVWLRPFVVGQDPAELHIGLFPDKGGEIDFEVYSKTSGAEGGEVVHAQGLAVLSAVVDPPRLDVAAIAARCQEGVYSAEACYAAYAALGLEYGAAHRGIEALQVGPGEVMARLSLPAAVADTRDRFVLHPSLMDAAVQALMGFSLAEDAGNGWAQRALPFEVREVEIYGPGTERMWAVVHRSAAAAGGAKIDRYDIDLCDETGRVSVRMRGLSTRSTRREGDAAARNEEPATLMAAAPPAVSDLQQRVQSALAQAITKLLKLRERHVDAGVEFGSLGFDSITFADFTRRLNKDYGLDLTPTVFFEYPTLEKFSRFLAETHQGVMASHFVPRQETPPPAARRVESAAPETRPSNGSARRARFAAAPRAASSPVLPASQNGAPEPIAIIGISGRFPMARDVDELWENLLNGRDCISEIPPQRWDWRAIYGDPRMEGNKTNVKWGGFIEGVDEFDPLFFNISPREARLMDPQQRLLMTHVWKVIEDAGYAGSSLAGSNTAIFVGAGLSDYDFVLGEPQVAIEDYSAIATAPSVGPHRMSYFLDLHGPSEPIETACSSSLLAVHRAVGAIRSGDCEMAIVGGVGTLLTPHRQVAYSKAGMLSPDGRCKTFSNRANGYVRGEGIGMLFLKKLREAEAAGDHIYGVIRGSSENHGGRANSLTAPNPKAQAELLKKAYLQAGVEPESVSYIETHGTGTELGDPIEIEGLKTAFSDLYRNRGSQPVAGHCGLGSVKSNIGHLEVAAGVAGIIKVLLQMQHKTLVPTLNCEPPNPYIQLAGSPFYIVREAMEWQARKDARGAELPRRAGVSSFSVSGANAHVVIEEYVPRDRQRSRSAAPERPVAVVLSARNEERLREQAQGLLAVLKKRGLADGDLLDVAYTLQVGREAMDARLGVVASSVGELEEKLLAFLGDGSKSGLYLGQARGNSEAMSILAAEEDFRGVVDRWIEQGRLDKVLDLWVKGMKVDWDRFYGEPKPRRLSLPTYPFARERYWATGATGAIWAATGATGATGATSGLTEPAPALRPAPSFVAAAPPAAAVHHQSPADELYEMLLTPVWEPLQTERQDVQRSSAGRMAIVGGTDDQRAAIRELHPEASLWALEPADSVEQMRRKIAPSGEIGHLVWIVPPHFPASPGDDSLLAAQSEGALFCFRLIKALLAEGYGDRLLTWSVITTETQAVHAGDLANPAHASVHGLVGSMAKEYADWNVRLLDLPASGEWPWRDLFAMAGDPHGNAAVYRGHRWYRRQLAPYRPGPETDTAYRPGGVYVVIGGAGGIGETWSEALLRRLPAQIVWIGRRPKDDAIQDKLDRLAALGPAPLYIAADATDYDQLESARATIKRELGRIDGVIHAAMVIQDHSLANMTEDEFRTGFSPKVDVCVRIAQVFGKEPLDFVLFFSSVAAFLKWPGQSNYVAGSTFEDAFADRLAAEWPCRVRVINWGYWAVGALDSERYRTLMARKGFGSIELPGAMQALDRLLSGPGRQLAYLAVLGPEALEGVGVLPAGWTAARTEDAQPAAPSPRQLAQGVAQETAAGSTVAPDKPGDITTESLLADLRLRVAETLGVDQAILDSPSRPFADALLGEFGMDSLSSNSLRNKLRRELGVDIPVHLIIGEKVHSIVGALYEQMLLQHVTKEPQHGNDEETETFVF